MYTDYSVTDQNVKDYQKYERTIKTINKRFKTYGYERIKTSTFERYDLYTNITSSINQKEMVKIIDRTGEVSVLRPDVTIPITKQLADHYTKLPNELRYYYVQDVFRNILFEEGGVESTQAGVEYFCETSPEADAEVIALACHTLNDLGFNDIKIEMGHAGFFQELIQAVNLSTRDLEQLKSLIQAKNIVDLEPFLQSFAIEKDVIEAFVKIPLLYGNPVEVSENAKKIVRTAEMKKTLDYLLTVYRILKIYGLEQNIVMDLGLINHMGYYSDVIFQGFVGKFGKPVLMGGRYNHLGNEFGANLPAIGFACEVESLVQASTTDITSPRTPIDVTIVYMDERLEESITISNELRERNYSVISLPIQKKSSNVQKCIYKIEINSNGNFFIYRNKNIQFSSIRELLRLMSQAKGAL